jgi:hypothetical protein
VGHEGNTSPTVRIRWRSKALKAGKDRGRRIFRKRCYGAIAEIVIITINPAVEERQEGNSGARSLGTCQRGETPEERNPMGVTGMKQGRAFERGGNRREGEKP